MLPVIDRAGRLTTLMVLLYSLALLPVGLTSTLLGITGKVFPAVSLLLGGLLLATGLMLHRSRSASNARRVFLASIIYLPVLLAFMVVDREAPRMPAAGAAVAVVQPAAAGVAAPAALPASAPAAAPSPGDTRGPAGPSGAGGS
jgi:hypothetical protein